MKDIRNLLQRDVDEIVEGCCLSDEEAKILELVAHQKSLVQIADRLAICESTVSNRIRHIKQKMKDYYSFLTV